MEICGIAAKVEALQKKVIEKILSTLCRIDKRVMVIGQD